MWIRSEVGLKVPHRFQSRAALELRVAVLMRICRHVEQERLLSPELTHETRAPCASCLFIGLALLSGDRPEHRGCVIRWRRPSWHRAWAVVRDAEWAACEKVALAIGKLHRPTRRSVKQRPMGSLHHRPANEPTAKASAEEGHIEEPKTVGGSKLSSGRRPSLADRCAR